MARTVNIASHLPDIASRRPDALAAAFPTSWDGRRHEYAEWSFKRLEEESNRIARGLASAGIGRGTRTVLMVKPSLDFFALTFALFKTGAVPVLIDPGLGLKNLKACLAEAAPEAFIGVPKAHAARIVLGWAKDSLKILITVGGPKLWGGATLSRIKDGDGSAFLADTREEDMAAILFTSGSTGAPKGAVYSHGNFEAQMRLLKSVYAIRPGEIDVATFPLFALFAPALGMSSVIADMDFTRPARVDAAKIAFAVLRYQATQMFGSPALIDRVGRYLEEKNVSLPSLRRVISAGAPVPAKVLERMSRHLSPEAEIHTPYGATEALPVATIGSREILGETRRQAAEGRGVCVGRPVPETEVRIIRMTDRALPAWSEEMSLPSGEVGEIAVRGPAVTREYYNRPSSTRRAKIAGAAAGSFFHRMGDLGYLDERGRLWFCGRKAHRVATPDRCYYTVACEGVFNEHPDVLRTALVGVRAGRLLKPVLCVELEKSGRRASETRVREELLELGAKYEHTASIRTILFHDAFPVDIRHNAKIFREKLARWAQERAA